MMRARLSGWPALQGLEWLREDHEPPTPHLSQRRVQEHRDLGHRHGQGLDHGHALCPPERHGGTGTQARAAAGRVSWESVFSWLPAGSQEPCTAPRDRNVHTGGSLHRAEGQTTSDTRTRAQEHGEIHTSAWASGGQSLPRNARAGRKAATCPTDPLPAMSPGAEAVSLACWPQSSPREGEGEGEVTQTPRPFLLNKNLRPLKGQAPENHYNVFSSHKAKNAVLPVD